MSNSIEKRKLTLQIDTRIAEIKRLSSNIKREYELISEYVVKQKESKQDSKEDVKKKIEDYCLMFSNYKKKKEAIFKEIAELTNKKHGNKNGTH